MRAKVEIDAPPKEVWSALLNIDTVESGPSDWCSVDTQPPGPIRTGSVVIVTTRLADDEVVSRREFVLVDEYKLRVVLREGTHARSTTTFDVQPVSIGRTLLLADRVHHSLFFRAFDAIVLLFGTAITGELQGSRRRLMAFLEGIKAHCEGREPPPEELDSLDQVELELEREGRQR